MSWTAAVLWVLLAAPQAKGPAFAEASAREAVLQRAAALPLGERMVAVSEGFLGTAYGVSPLGEGTGRDPDPTLRFDSVDCLTFVETVMAMGLSPGPGEVEPLLQRIRYAGSPAYEERNHLMEAQWLPNNLAKGFLRTLTGQMGGSAVLSANKKLTAQSWSGKSAVALGLPADRRLQGNFELPIVPLAQALEVANKAPTGTIVVVVREDRPALVTRVSHLGFLVKKKRPMLRHASRTFGKVVDEDLESFLARNVGYARWTVTGLAFYEVRAP